MAQTASEWKERYLVLHNARPPQAKDFLTLYLQAHTQLAFAISHLQSKIQHISLKASSTINVYLRYSEMALVGTISKHKLEGEPQCRCRKA